MSDDVLFTQLNKAGTDQKGFLHRFAFRFARTSDDDAAFAAWQEFVQEENLESEQSA